MHLLKRSEKLPQTQLVEAHNRVKRFQLAKLLKVTEEMLEHARSGNWAKVEEIEIMRKLELDECFSLQDQEEPSALIAEALATLIFLNEQVVKIVKTAREKVSTENQKHSITRKAVSLYSNETE